VGFGLRLTGPQQASLTDFRGCHGGRSSPTGIAAGAGSVAGERAIPFVLCPSDADIVGGRRSLGPEPSTNR